MPGPRDTGCPMGCCGGAGALEEGEFTPLMDGARAVAASPGVISEVKQPAAAPPGSGCGRAAGVAALIALAGVSAVAVHQLGHGQEPVLHPVVQPGVPSRSLELPLTASCTLFGDPHLKSFDGGRPNFYGEGEFYLVRAPADAPDPTINIQGRYMGTKYTAGLAATNKIIVGGTFLEGHTIAVGDMEDGRIMIDGEHELTGFPDSYVLPGLGNITYGTEGKEVDKATSQWEKHVVKMILPKQVVIEVFRWTNYLDVNIVMPQQEGGQDGSCGNFNGDPSDDSDEDVFNRIGARVREDDLLFNERADERVTSTEDQLLQLCQENKTKYENAKQECEKDLLKSYEQPSVQMQKSCWLDICFGMDRELFREAQRIEKNLGSGFPEAPPPGEAMD